MRNHVCVCRVSGNYNVFPPPELVLTGDTTRACCFPVQGQSFKTRNEANPLGKLGLTQISGRSLGRVNLLSHIITNSGYTWNMNEWESYTDRVAVSDRFSGAQTQSSNGLSHSIFYSLAPGS